MNRGEDERSFSDTDGLDPRLLVDGAARLGLHFGPVQIDQFRRFYQGMIEWNTRVNLTRITDWAQVQERHFLESIAVAQVVPADILGGGTFVDVGTGPGVPGIPLKICFPEMTGALIDATRKKVDFLQWVLDAIGLEGLDVYHGRAEVLAHQPAMRETFDLVVARAVARMPVLAEFTLPFCRLGGLTVLHKTFGAADEIDLAGHAIDVLGGRLRPMVGLHPSSTCDRRSLVTIQKVNPTPARYPRRSGIPAKRPILIG